MTASLEVSKELVKRGMVLETEKWWVNATRGHSYEGEVSWLESSINKGNWELYYGKVEFPDEIDFDKGEYDYKQAEKLLKEIECVSAPSTDELLVVMPIKIFIGRYYTEREWRAVDNDENRNIPTEVGGNPADCLAKMCLWLLDNGYHYDEKQKIIRRNDAPEK